MLEEVVISTINLIEYSESKDEVLLCLYLLQSMQFTNAFLLRNVVIYIDIQKL